MTEEGLAAAGDAPRVTRRHAPDRPAHPDADAGPLQRRIDNLRDLERRARALAHAHLHPTAAAAPPDQAGIPSGHGEDAREARRRAVKCLNFARICRSRAARLKKVLDSLFE